MMTSLRSKWAVGKTGELAPEGASRPIFGLLFIWVSPVAGTKMERDVTNEQHSRRSFFNATFRATASWLFFRVARQLTCKDVTIICEMAP
jgi:hypothetical protein